MIGLGKHRIAKSDGQQRIGQILTLTGYSAVLAMGAFALNWLEYKSFAWDHSGEITTLAVAAGFLALGIWLGGRWTPAPGQKPFQKNHAAINAFAITRREYAVLELLASGQTNKEIARVLDVSPNTVKTHIANLFTKLDVQRRTQAVTRAQSFNMIA